MNQAVGLEISQKQATISLTKLMRKFQDFNSSNARSHNMTLNLL